MDDEKEIVACLKVLTGNWSRRSNGKHGKFDQGLSCPKLEHMASEIQVYCATVRLPCCD
jgi:hypothetical protein